MQGLHIDSAVCGWGELGKAHLLAKLLRQCLDVDLFELGGFQEGVDRRRQEVECRVLHQEFPHFTASAFSVLHQTMGHHRRGIGQFHTISQGFGIGLGALKSLGEGLRAGIGNRLCHLQPLHSIEPRQIGASPEALSV